MHKVLSVAIGLLSSVCFGQYVERIMYIPDALSGISAPGFVMLHGSTSRAYVAGNFQVISINTATGRKESRIDVPTGGNFLCSNPVSNKVYCPEVDSSRVAVIDPTADTIIAHVSVGSYPNRLCLSTRSNRVYCANLHSACVSVIDGASNAVICHVPGIPYPRAMCYNPRDNKIYCTSSPGQQLSVIDCSTNTVRATLPIGDWSSDLVYNAQENKVYCISHWAQDLGDGDDVHVEKHADRGSLFEYAADTDTWSITVIDGAADSVLAKVRTRGLPSAACLNTVGNRLYALDPHTGVVDIVNCTTDSVVKTLAVGVGGSTLTFVPTHNRIYITRKSRDSIVVIDGAADSVICAIVAGRRPAALAYDSAHDALLCANSGDGSVSVIDCSSNRVTSTILTLKGEPTRMLHNPMTNRLYALNPTPGFVSVVDCASDSVVIVRTPDCPPYEVCLSQAGNKLGITGGHQILILDGSADTVLARFRTMCSAYAPCYNAVADKFYAVTDQARVHIVSGATNQLVDSLQFEMEVMALAANSINGKLYCGFLEEALMAVVDGYGDTVTTIIPGDGCTRCMLYDSRRNKVYCQKDDADSAVYVVDGVSDSIVAVMPGPAGASDICLGATVNKLYLAEDNGPAVYVYDAVADTFITSVVVGNQLRSLGYDSVHNRLYCVRGEYSGVFVIDGRTDSLVTVIPLPSAAEQVVCNGPGGRVYVSLRQMGAIAVIRDTGAALADGPATQPAGTRVGPTVVRGVLWLTLAPSLKPQATSLLDAAGRRVMDLSPGANDVSRLPSGVYFVREELRASSPKPQAVTKVVIQR